MSSGWIIDAGTRKESDVSLFDFADACDYIDNSSFLKASELLIHEKWKTHYGYWKPTAGLLEKDNIIASSIMGNKFLSSFWMTSTGLWLCYGQLVCFFA